MVQNTEPLNPNLRSASVTKPHMTGVEIGMNMASGLADKRRVTGGTKSEASGAIRSKFPTTSRPLLGGVILKPSKGYFLCLFDNAADGYLFSLRVVCLQIIQDIRINLVIRPVTPNIQRLIGRHIGIAVKGQDPRYIYTINDGHQRATLGGDGINHVFQVVDSRSHYKLGPIRFTVFLISSLLLLFC
jgi:hypothetical protein